MDIQQKETHSCSVVLESGSNLIDRRKHKDKDNTRILISVYITVSVAATTMVKCSLEPGNPTKSCKARGCWQ